MDALKLIEVIPSHEANASKYLYQLNRPTGKYMVEVGVLDKGDGKDIICIPTQTNCAQGCLFCHSRTLTPKIESTNLHSMEIEELVRSVWIHAGLNTHTDKTLLISMMGLGEPMANRDGILAAMMGLRNLGASQGIHLRFALATMLPEAHLADFEVFTRVVEAIKIPVKVHFSMHFPRDAERQKWMPAAAKLETSLALLDRYADTTGNPVEIHYALMQGMNDSFADTSELALLLVGHKFPVKLLHYNSAPVDVLQPSSAESLSSFRNGLTACGIEHEHYISPGRDIGICCGSFFTGQGVVNVEL